MKILVIDNDCQVLLFIEKHMSQLGYEVITAKDGNEGIAFFEKENPDIVLVDINMPDLSGLNVLRQIRFVHESQIPVIIMLEKSYEQVVNANLGQGVDYFIKKPFGLEDISKKITQVLNVNTKSFEPVKQFQLDDKEQVGVIVPCQNVEDILLNPSFINIPFNKLGYHICFVNQGSVDQTQLILESLQEKYPEVIRVCKGYNLENDEAIRVGVQHFLADETTRYVGFLDAQITTDFIDYKDLVKIVKNSDFKIVNGARIARMDMGVTKQTAKRIIGSTVHIIMQTVLNIPFMENHKQKGVIHFN
ncbi:response regulator [Maribacter sp. LLG6340-A2]|uniref:response regulator n=1 Tax=Maribacter sp. LLG6340-A2 TaxID=3160834 RepID=UPI00386304DD